MDDFSTQLNNILVDTYRSISKVEEQMLKSSRNIDLSIIEIHLIEAVGKNGNNGKNISDIAKSLDITLPSVTIAINKLARKGYAEKVKCEEDGRVVNVMLTRQGLKINAAHRYFHENMVRAVSKNISEQEKKELMNGISKLNAFLRQKLIAMEEK
jgi:DNA-binding MarR family transcriptional regulator